MTVVRITIKKKLTQGAYAYRQFMADSFSSDYLVRTDASFPSSEIKEYAVRIATAESELYPARVRFESAIAKLSTPGATAEELRGQFTHIGLGQMKGRLETGEDETLAFPSVTAVYGRQAVYGRHGRLLMPHALTTTEWNLYAHQHVSPVRFMNQGTDAVTTFSDALLAATAPSNGIYVMPASEGDTPQSLREINRFFFLGFQVASSKAIRKKRKSSAAKSSQVHPDLQQCELHRESYAPNVDPSARVKVPVAGVVYLLQAGDYFKIGKSIDLDKRLGQIKLQLPYPVEVVHVIQAAHPLLAEAHWHRRFSALRRNGEWFLLTQTDVDEFKSVSNM